MRLKLDIRVLLGGASLTGLALGALVVLGPPKPAPALSDLLLHGALLILFWLGYLTSLIYVLCCLGNRLFGQD